MRRKLPKLICLGVAILVAIIGIIRYELNVVTLPLTIAFLALFIVLGTDEDGKYRIPKASRSITICVLCLLSAVFTCVFLFASKGSLTSYTCLVIRYVLGFLALAVASAALLVRVFYHLVKGQRYEFRSVWKTGKTWLILDTVFICLNTALWLLG